MKYQEPREISINYPRPERRSQSNKFREKVPPSKMNKKFLLISGYKISCHLKIETQFVGETKNRSQNFDDSEIIAAVTARC